jgi:hypothetical protein
MKRNFEFLSSVELSFEGKIVDLHNIYGLIACVVSFDEKKVTLKFEVVYHTDNDKQEDRPISIEFARVNNIDMHVERLLEGRAYESLEDIGFKTPGDTDLSWLLDNTETSDGDDIVFLLTDGEYIRVGAGSCMLTLVSKPSLISS